MHLSTKRPNLSTKRPVYETSGIPKGGGGRYCRTAAYVYSNVNSNSYNVNGYATYAVLR